LASIFVTYKAVLTGVPVVFVPPAYTSQTCSRGHHVHPEKGKSYRNGKMFKCGHGGLEADSAAVASLRASADWNAANNIATLGVTFVNQPKSSVMSCVLDGQLSFLCSTFHQG
jgi:transposase